MQLDIPAAIKQVGHIIDIWLPWKIKYDHIPGLSVALAYRGKILYAKGFGYADVEKKIRADEKTLYHIASHSKMFTSVAIFKLIEEGKLQLDDHVNKYVDWFTAKSKISSAANITVRQLLSHTAGIFRDGDTPHWVTGRFPKDLKKSFSEKSLILENQTKFKYTNYGYGILGLVIEKASGMSYAEYVESKILKPLKMGNTYADYIPGTKHIAAGYGTVFPDTKRVKFDHSITHAYAPATGFVSNAIDLMKFISSLSLTASGPILRESKKEMMRSHSKTDDEDEYGLGLDIYYENGRKIIGHGGGFNGFSTSTFLDTEKDIAITVLTNGMQAGTSAIRSGILNAIISLLDETQKYSSNVKINFGRYEGLYRDPWGDDIIVRAGDILLSFSPKANKPTQAALRLLPTKTRDVFIMKSKYVFGSYDENATFKDFKKGKAQIMVQAASPSKRVE